MNLYVNLLVKFYMRNLDSCSIISRSHIHLSQIRKRYNMLLLITTLPINYIYNSTSTGFIELFATRNQTILSNNIHKMSNATSRFYFRNTSLFQPRPNIVPTSSRLDNSTNNQNSPVDPQKSNGGVER